MSARRRTTARRVRTSAASGRRPAGCRSGSRAAVAIAEALRVVAAPALLSHFNCALSARRIAVSERLLPRRRQVAVELRQRGVRADCSVGFRAVEARGMRAASGSSVSNAAAVTDRRACAARTGGNRGLPRAFFGFLRVIGLIVAGSRACSGFARGIRGKTLARGACRCSPKPNSNAPINRR